MGNLLMTICLHVLAKRTPKENNESRIPASAVGRMIELCRYADRPFAFVGRYLCRHKASHAIILSAVVAAVACSVGTQYGVKFLVDSLAATAPPGSGIWLAFAFLVALIAADNLLWRVASWTANSAFVAVTGDVRRDLF